MIRTLCLIAAFSFVLAVGCFAGVIASAGGPFFIDDRGVVHHIDWSHPHDWSHPDVDEQDRAAPDRPGAPSTPRQFTWPGGRRLVIDVPADVTYTQGPKIQLTISGPEELISRLSVQDGVIEADGIDFDDGRLKISLTAPDVDSFSIDGDADLTIAGYNRDQLALKISGSGTAKAEGQAKRAELRISGSGDADLSGLKLGDARVHIAGSGDATLDPKGEAVIDISGSGDVRLVTRPRSETVNISGSGRVDQPDAG
ncbi:MAG TPA: DUF2807 domain-containing protein [Caulobacteraceae bacterium]|jgi:hypothetical protein